MSDYYKTILKSWRKLNDIFRPETKNQIKKKMLFGSNIIQFKKNPLFFPSFTRSGIYLIEHIWDNDNKSFLCDGQIYQRLDDKRNCIAELSRIKKAIPKDWMDSLKKDTSEECQNNMQTKTYFLETKKTK